MTAKSTLPGKSFQPIFTYDAFLSHASQDAGVAFGISFSLTKHHLTIWTDDSHLLFGGLLREELQKAIESSRVLVLIWSQAASQSRWVMAEIFTAFHLDRFIIPYVVDDTALPQFLQNSAYLNRQRDEKSLAEKLARAIRGAPPGTNKIAPWMGGRTQLVQSMVNGIGGAQIGAVLAMTQNFQKASEVNSSVRTALESAMQLAPDDPMMLNLAGYQCKNDYMFGHWEAIRAGRAPKDPLLEKGERYFFEALCIDPTDANAVNGLGSILMFERELDAAEFFVRRAIDIIKRTGGQYEAAEIDLQRILALKQRAL